VCIHSQSTDSHRRHFLENEDELLQKTIVCIQITSFTHPTIPSLGPTQPPLKWVPGLLPGVKRPEPCVEHPARKELHYNSTYPVCVFMDCCRTNPELFLQLHTSIIIIIIIIIFFFFFLFFFFLDGSTVQRGPSPPSWTSSSQMFFDPFYHFLICV